MPSLFTLMAPVLLLLSAVVANAQQGGISLNQTRVIFSSEDLAQTVAVKNNSSRSWLIHSRILSEAENDDAPFIVTPPLFPLKGNSSQQLRILLKQASLPADRESLFYLSVIAMPSHEGPVPDAGKLSVGVRFVLKLFYRPVGLQLARNDAACHLIVSAQGGELRIVNPTPYFQTLSVLKVNDHVMAIPAQKSMIAPYDSLALPVERPLRRAIWQTITDYGTHSEPCSQTF